MAVVRDKIKVEGLSELTDSLRELPKATQTNVLKRTLITSGKLFLDTMDQLVPVRKREGKGKGRLKRSLMIGTRLSRNQKRISKKQSKVEVYVGPGPLIEAITSEFGTGTAPPQPFVRPAWDRNKEAVLKSIVDDMRKQIDKAAKRMARKAARLAAKIAAGK